MTALAPLPMEPINTDEAYRHAKRLASSSLVPEALRGKPDDVLIVVMMGHRLGLGPDQAVQSIHVVKGKPVMSADLIVAQCLRRADLCLYFSPTEIGAERCSYVTRRTGAPGAVTLTYTMAEAKLAGLTGKGNWQSHPADMLRARCAAKLARAVYPDLVLGLYAPEEMQGERPAAKAAPSSLAELVAVPITPDEALEIVESERIPGEEG